MAANRAHGALLHGGFGVEIFADKVRSYGIGIASDPGPSGCP